MAVATTAKDKNKAYALPEYTVDQLPLTYEVSRREKSNWIPKDKSKHKPIDCAKIIMVEMRSRWNAGPKVGEVQIMYIPGAPTVFVNDYYDTEGEKQPGLKTLGYDMQEGYARAVAEDIKFQDGRLYLENYGGRNNATLLLYMFLHGSNEESPNFQRRRNINTMFLFKPMMPEKKAGVQLENIEVEAEAMNLYTSLREKNGKEYKYNVAQIDAILGMLQEGQGYGPNESNAKMLVIYPHIKFKATKFMAMYNGVMGEYRMAIGLGQKFKIIDFNANDATIKVPTMQPLKRKVSFDSMDKNIEELIFWFLGTAEGRVQYNMVMSAIEAAKLEAFSKN